MRGLQERDHLKRLTTVEVGNHEREGMNTPYRPGCLETHHATRFEVVQIPGRCRITASVMRCGGIPIILSAQNGPIPCCPWAERVNQGDPVCLSGHRPKPTGHGRNTHSNAGRMRSTSTPTRDVRPDMTHLPAGKGETFLTYCPRARQPPHPCRTPFR